jgi:bifunctional DNA-binding transcriptional regulator/antitoxin component of YhaV-PrlF toxin-antitoxin module
MKATKVTTKGTTTIPLEIRRAAGVTTGSWLEWNCRRGVIEARPRHDKANAMQRHIAARAGTWDGYLSGEALLKRTRP